MCRGNRYRSISDLASDKVQVRVVWPDGEDSDWVEITRLNRWIELAR